MRDLGGQRSARHRRAGGRKHLYLALATFGLLAGALAFPVAGRRARKDARCAEAADGGCLKPLEPSTGRGRTQATSALDPLSFSKTVRCTPSPRVTPSEQAALQACRQIAHLAATRNEDHRSKREVTARIEQVEEVDQATGQDRVGYQVVGPTVPLGSTADEAAIPVDEDTVAIVHNHVAADEGRPSLKDVEQAMTPVNAPAVRSSKGAVQPRYVSVYVITYDQQLIQIEAKTGTIRQYEDGAFHLTPYTAADLK